MVDQGVKSCILIHVLNFKQIIPNFKNIVFFSFCAWLSSFYDIIMNLILNHIQRVGMNDSNYTEPIIPPMQSNPDLKEYYCPYCDKFLFKGNVKKLHMVCQHCQKLISASEAELFKTKTTEE